MISFDALSNSVGVLNSYTFVYMYIFHYTKITQADNSTAIPFRFTGHVKIDSLVDFATFPPRITGKLEFFFNIYIYSTKHTEKVTLFLKPLAECSGDTDVVSDIAHVFLNSKLTKLNFRQILSNISVFYKVRRFEI